MLSVTFAAFQDELVKIAEGAKFSPVTQPLPTRKPAGAHLFGVGDETPSIAARPKTTVGEGAKAAVSERTGVVGPPKALQPELSKTHARAAMKAVPHSPLPHPAVPGGLGRAMTRGASMMRAHATPLGIGAAAGLGLGALAMHHGARQDASSR